MKTREPRRKVMLEARLRSAQAWHDARILNLSTRGLMMQTSATLSRNTYLEVRRGSHIIVGRVVWAAGRHVGLKAQDRLPVEAIVSDIPVKAPTNDAGQAERRNSPRDRNEAVDRNRHVGRVYQAVALGLTGVFGVACIAILTQQILATPMERIATSLTATKANAR